MAKQKVVEAFNAPVLTGGFAIPVVNTEGFSFLHVWWTLLAAGAAADLASMVVTPVRVDGTTAIANGITAVRAFGASVASGGDAHYMAQYDIRGMGKVKVSAQNANAGTKTMVVTCYLGKEG